MIDAGPVAVVVEASGQSLGITRAACAVPMRLTPATGARLTAAGSGPVPLVPPDAGRMVIVAAKRVAEPSQQAAVA